jgi:hypothetical protein
VVRLRISKNRINLNIIYIPSKVIVPVTAADAGIVIADVVNVIPDKLVPFNIAGR